MQKPAPGKIQAPFDSEIPRMRRPYLDIINLTHWSSVIKDTKDTVVVESRSHVGEFF